MSALWVLVFIGLVAAAGYVVGFQRAAALQTGPEKAHSLPSYHGWWAALLALLPALLFFIVWSVATGVILEGSVRAQLAEADPNIDPSLASGMTHTVADALRALGVHGMEQAPADFAALAAQASARGLMLPSEGQDYMIPAALQLNETGTLLGSIGAVVAVALCVIGAIYGVSRIRLRSRARNHVERVMLWGLLGASTIAILTTVGIVLSMLSETGHFFTDVNPLSFFFGTVWDPRFAAAGAADSEGQFGLIPLLAGTLYIAFVSMLVAVPIGLMAAIYMGEYASASARAIIKPALELLAGIPTIVYGIFAVVTLGPFLRDLSAVLAGGTPFIQAQSVFTAGLVMGVMLIPVVSSLSDDVITAVPRAMRDGSLGLGATQSETIKRVILPAALPGIVGALLLTASRAIGETMIVVLAAGVAARLTINPFEAMTTITVKIVNQLTGDLEFNSPQTLVAFALGLTLFALTLVMNVYALYIVRKYREQYE